MFKASFGLSETGSVRESNQDSYLLDATHGILAVADGLGGLPNGQRASSMTVDILHKKLLKDPALQLQDLISAINEETREFGYNLNAAGFGTTLTMIRCLFDQQQIEMAHVGDSAAYLVSKGQARRLTIEHTVAARMVSSHWEEDMEDIPLSAHHPLTQCIGQELYIDPQFLNLDVQTGDRLFLLTDGSTKPVEEAQLIEALCLDDQLDRVCQALTFRIEIAGSPDNYTMVAVEF